MGLEDIYADGINDSIQKRLRNPPAPESESFSAWSFLASGAKGPVSGALESGGSIADILSAYGTAAAASGGSGQGMFSTGTALEKQQIEEANKALLQGGAFDVKAGNALRRKADEFAPNPETSTKADQVIHGLTRFAGKAIFDVAAMGPVAGATALALDEGNTTTQRLRTEGVDTTTAAGVGAVTGVLSGVGAVLPVGGSTIAKTAALAILGGPASYMAQESLSKKILADAGYNDQASLHNPTDPLGLALSIVVPGAFGAIHMRGVAKRASLQDVVQHIESGGQRYDKAGEILTSPKGAQGEMQVMPATSKDPGFGVTPAKDNSPDELARVGRDYLAAMQKRYQSADQALAAYNAGPGAVDAAMKAHGDNWLAHMPEETQKYVAKADALMGEHITATAAKDPAMVDAARVQVLNESIAKSLPEHPEAYHEVMRASDEVAAGRMPDVTPIETKAIDAPISESVDSQGNPFITAKTEAGHVAAKIENGEMRVVTADIADESLRGQGHGVAMYTSLANEALRRGIAMASDETVEMPAVHVYQALERRGYTVERNPAARELPSDTPGLYAPKGESVFRVTKAPEKQAAQSERPQRSDATNTLPSNDSVSLAGDKSEPTANAGAPKAKPATPKSAGKEEAKTPEAQRLESLSKEQPDMKVRLPGSEETVTLTQAMEQAKAEFEHDSNEVSLYQAALDCALSFGA